MVAALLAPLLRWAEPPPGPPRGLTLHEFGDGRDRIRLHLRVEEDGGLLFRDVTDVVHLNETAVEIAHAVLHGQPRRRALAGMRRRWSVPPAELERDWDRVESLVRTLSAPVSGCRTCLAELPRTALFGRRARAPYKVDLALTYDCNNACPHCYNEPSRFGMPPLPRAEWARILDTLARVGVPHVILTGGEPTMHPEVLGIVEDAAARGLVAGMNSNGRRFAADGFAEQVKAAGLDHLQVTIESHRSEVHDAMQGVRAWHQSVRGIRRALDAGLLVLTNTTLTRANARDVEPFLDFVAGELGLGTFAMNGIIHSGGGAGNPDALAPEELAAVLVQVRDGAARRGLRFLWYTPTEYCRLNPVEIEIGAKRCNAGEYSICVEPDGSVLPCQSYYTRAGNVLTDRWEDIWSSALLRSFREREQQPLADWLPAKCHGCPDLPLCGGGCRIEHEAAARGTTSEGGCSDGGCSTGGCGSKVSGGRASARAASSGFVALESLAPGAAR